MATRKPVAAPAAKKTTARKKPAKRVAPIRTAVAAAVSTAVRPRVALKSAGGEEAPSGFFVEANTLHDFIKTGCTVMDLALGGGWVLGRVANIVGDRSAGKTLLAIEACANFHMEYPKGLIRYAESEAAFDPSYAEALGMPLDAVDFGDDRDPLRTVEDWYRDMERFLELCVKKKVPGLYILDSFDALSDDAELERDIDKGSFGAGKAKKSGELFRRLVDRIEAAGVCLIVVSQLRDKLNVTFGETQTRSGGRALDFYASQIVWLAEIKKLDKTIEGVKRIVGVNVRARVKKNKVGLPFRECSYPIIFGYGIDDMTAGVEWLLEIKKPELLRDQLDISEEGYKLRIGNLRNKPGSEVKEFRDKLTALVASEWRRIDSKFVPKGNKYG